MTHESMNHEAVYRTAPATLGLLITVEALMDKPHSVLDVWEEI